jgi:hypothetical protein
VNGLVRYTGLPLIILVTGEHWTHVCLPLNFFSYCYVALNGFRATRVEPDQGYIEYVIALGHRSSWQDIGVILQSKADVASYCLELAKKLDMRYVAPALPVNLSMAAQSNMQLVNIDPKLGENAPRAAGISSPTPSSTGVPSVSSPNFQSISELFKHE